MRTQLFKLTNQGTQELSETEAASTGPQGSMVLCVYYSYYLSIFVGLLTVGIVGVNFSYTV